MKPNKEIHTLYTGFLALVGNTQTNVAATLTLTQILQETLLTEMEVEDEDEEAITNAWPMDRVEKEIASVQKPQQKYVLFQCTACGEGRIHELQSGPIPTCPKLGPCHGLPMVAKQSFQ